MTKDLSYYLSLKYPIELLEIPAEEGGGFSASIPLLGRYTCVGDGETVTEAVDDVARVKERVLKDLLGRGVAIPEPEADRSPEFSGRLLLRLPTDLHKKVAERATAKGESINRYIVNALEADARARIDELYSMVAHLLTIFEASRLQHSWHSRDPLGQLSTSGLAQIYSQTSMPTVFAATALVRAEGQEVGSEQDWPVLGRGPTRTGQLVSLTGVRRGQGAGT